MNLSSSEEEEFVSLNYLLEIAKRWEWPLMTVPVLFDKSDQIAVVDFLTEKGFEYEHYGYEDRGNYIESVITIDVPKLQINVLKDLPARGVRYQDPESLMLVPC